MIVGITKFSVLNTNKNYRLSEKKQSFEKPIAIDGFEPSFKRVAYRAELEKDLVHLKNENGEYIFRDYGLPEIVNSTNTSEQAKIKLRLVKDLSKIKYEDGDSRFDENSITAIVAKVKTEKHAKLALKLAKMKKDNGDYKFGGFKIGWILEKINEKHQKKLCSNNNV